MSFYLKIYATDYLDKELVYGSLSIMPLFSIFLLILGIYQVTSINNYAALIFGLVLLSPTILILSIELIIRKRLKYLNVLKINNNVSDLVNFFKKRFGWKTASEKLAEIRNEDVYKKLLEFIESDEKIRRKARAAHTFGLIGVEVQHYANTLHELLEKTNTLSKEEFIIAKALALIEGKKSKGLVLLEDRYNKGLLSEFHKDELFHLYQSLNAIEIERRVDQIQDTTEITDEEEYQELQSNDYRFLISKINELTKTNLELTKINTDLKKDSKPWVRFLFEIFLISLGSFLTWFFTVLLPSLQS